MGWHDFLSAADDIATATEQRREIDHERVLVLIVGRGRSYR